MKADTNLIGKQGEQRAVKFLKKQGLKILQTNFFSRFGEIDIIATNGEILHFIEVKTSKYYDGIERITPKKMQKLLLTIDFYIYQKQSKLPYQLDAIIVSEEIEWIKNITW